MGVVAVDIETSCGVESCPGYGLSNSSKCEHALHHKQNKIDIIGVYDGKNYCSFRTVHEWNEWVSKIKDIGIIFHGGKFDYKTMRGKGCVIVPHMVVGDTQLLGACVAKKVDAEWLSIYNATRKELNEHLPPKQRHRVGTPLTLKAMSPYYIGVAPFWENPADHSDPEYNRKDCEYTYALHERLLELADQDGTLSFYKDYLLPWQKLLAEAEYEGVLIDVPLLHKMYADACVELESLEAQIHEAIGECFDAYRTDLVAKLTKESNEKCDKFVTTRIKNADKVPGVKARYAESLATKIVALPTKFNLQSSQQMLFILTYYRIDTTVEKRDKETNEWIEKEGTDKYVLKRAKVGGNEFAERLLSYRTKETEVSYLKQYINAVVDGRIYCTFNIVGTRTGRLSSSGPNLQNVKGTLRKPFIIAEGDKYSIYTVDASQIEPRVIAYPTQDQEMVRLFQEGRDYHNYATKKFFPEETQGAAEADIKKTHSHLRKTAKIGDLSIIYGTGKFTFQTMCLLREEMDIPLERAQEMVNSFRAGMKGPMAWKQALEGRYKQGEAIHDNFGFLVQARDASSVHMTLFNTFVQGMASRMIFHASLLAFRYFRRHKIDAKPLLWVHDEVCWRLPKGREDECVKIIDKYMKGYKLETVYGNVPLDVEGKVASSWEK